MNLTAERKRVESIGKDKYIKELVTTYKKHVYGMSVLDIITDHMELKEEYRNIKLMNKIRKLNVSEARKLYVQKYKNELEKLTLSKLISQYV